MIHTGDSLTLTATSLGLSGTATWMISGNDGFMDASAPFTTTDGIHYTSQVTLNWSQLQQILTVSGVVDDGPQLLEDVAVQVDAPDGQFTSAPTTLQILDTPPTAQFSGVNTTVGQATTVSFANPMDYSKEEAEAGYTYSYDFYNNGIFEQSGSSPTATVPADITAHPGTYTIHGRISDSLANYTDYTTQITVADVAPDVTVVGPDQPVSDGTVVSLGSAAGFTWNGYSTPGHAETFTAMVNWGDGTTTPAAITITSLPGEATSATLAATHRFAPGNYTVSVSVEDAYGSTGSASFKVLVGAPQVTVDAGSNQTINEGSYVSLLGVTFSDTAAPITHTVTVNWGDGTGTFTLPAADVSEPGLPTDLGTIAASHPYGTDGTFPVTVTVSDGLTGGTNSSTFDVTVKNVVPIVNAGPDQFVGVGNPVSINATFSDPGFSVNGVGETYTATIDWGDNITTTGTVSVVPGSARHAHDRHGHRDPYVFSDR